MSKKSMTLEVDRRDLRTNNFKGISEMSNPNVVNMAIDKKLIADAKIIALSKNPNIDSGKETVEWVLNYFISMHDVMIKEKIKKP